MPTQNPRNPFPAWRLPNGMIKASDDELEKSIESCERWEWFGGGLVVFGLAASVAIAAIHPKYDSFLEQWGSVIADGLVAIGVVIEIKFGQMAGLRQSELKRRSDILVAEANKHASEANERASEANVRAAFAMFGLEKLKGPRHFPVERRQAIVDLLKPFSGIRFKLSSLPQDSETAAFVSQLRDILIVSGWHYQDIPATKVGFTSGVYILATSDDMRILWAAKRLKSAMTACGIVAELGLNDDPSEATDIEIVVATKKI